jgi:hypothetical protein
MSAAATPDPATPDDHLYARDGEEVVPSGYCQGPWDPSLQHGGPVTGLLAWAATRPATAAPMRLARLTVDLFRGVPLAPLRPVATVRRDGRRIQAVDVSLFHEGTEVARATAVRIRTEPVGLGSAADRLPIAVPPPLLVDDRSGLWPGGEPVWVPGFVRAVELRNVVGTQGAGGERFVWTRLRCPLIAGEPADPVLSLATLVDYASGLANPLDFRRFTSINPDLSLHLLRAPQGAWVGLDAWTDLAPDGIGQSEARVFDVGGRVGRVSTSLVVDERPAPTG